MIDNIMRSIENINDFIETTQNSNIAILKLLKDLDVYFEHDKDYPDIKEMLIEIVNEVDVASDTISHIYPQLDAIASEICGGYLT